MKLAENDFKLVPAGENVVLHLESIDVKPKSNPSVITAVFKHENGGSIKNTYDVKKDRETGEVELSEKSLWPFTYLARCVLGNELKDFSLTNDLPKLQGAYIECEVVHNKGNKGGTFANIAKTIKLVDTPVQAESVDEDDDL